jgi:hypothetical protein
MAINIVQSTTAEVGQVLEFLAELHGKIDQAQALINLLGWELPPGVEDIGLASLDLGDFLEKLNAVIGAPDEEWENELAMLGRIADLTLAVNELVQTVLTLADELPVKLASFGDYVDRTQIHKELPKRLVDFLLSNYMANRSPLAFAVLHLIDVIDYPHFEADPSKFQIEHVRPVIHYRHFKTLVTDPAQLAKEAYGWNTPQFVAMRFLQRLNLLFQTLGMRSRIQPLNRDAEQIWLNRTVSETAGTMPQLITFFFEERGAIAGFRLGLSMFGVRPTAEGATDGGLGLVPIVQGQVQGSIPFFRFEDTFIDLAVEASLLKGMALILRPAHDPELRLAPSVGENIAGRFALGVRHGSPQGEPKTFLALPGGTGMQIQQAILLGGMEKISGRPAESFMELGLLGGRFVFSLEQADAFVQESIPREKVGASFDLKARWTQHEGIHFQGSSGLFLILPVHDEIGPFTLNSLTLGLNVETENLTFLSAIGGSLRLGPLTAAIEGLGLKLEVTFEQGNLGTLGLAPRFKPPDGLGLSIDGGGFTGGGFLRYVETDQRYEGMLELEYEDQIALKAIGLLTTRLPGGKPGFSLLIIITAEFNPIQLGLGFTLNGVGGLLGLNRTADVERLRSGLRDNTLSSVLFPQNVIENASRILSDLNQLFPAQRDRFLFGPMARIGWGSPTLITIDLGLMIEIPEPVRLLILGVIRATLPDEKAKLLQLQVNFLGVIDFQAQRLAIDASLYDSKLLSFTLSGDMAVRLHWGAEPDFLLSVGGFHPAYHPPPLNLPVLRRLSLQLTAGDNPRLTLETYFAVTSNTVQFGAKVELLAKAGSFNAYGFLSFDVLFQFNPFHFIAAISAKIALRVGSNEIASISLDFTLEGPTPWRAQGTAKLKICWFLTIKVHFDKTFGEARDTRLADVAVLPLLRAALGDKSNWVADPAGDRRQLVSLKEIQASDDQMVVAPFGVLTIQQRVAPLGITIQRFGSQRPADGDRFAIEQVTAGEGSQSEPLEASPVSELFAPAQFFELSDAQKLSSKSFERYVSGVKLVDSEEFAGEYAIRREVAYEMFYIDEQRDLAPQGKPVRPDFLSFHSWALQGAVANSPLSQARNGRSALAPGAVQVSQEGFAVVNASNLRPVAGAQAESEAGAQRLMQGMLHDNPSLESELLVVPAFEVNRS